MKNEIQEAVFVLFTLTCLFLLDAFIIQLLWNGLASEGVLGVKEITFWQACGLKLLVRIFITPNYKSK